MSIALCKNFIGKKKKKKLYIYYANESTKVQTLGGNIGTFGLETPICKAVPSGGAGEATAPPKIFCISAHVHTMRSRGAD